MRIVAVTSCAAGIAHTYMAAESLKKAAENLGHTIKVETRGTIGIENAITPDEVAKADLVIIASDVGLDLSKFDGKPQYSCSTQRAITNGKSVVLEAIAQGMKGGKKSSSGGGSNNSDLNNIQFGKTKNSFFKHLLGGVGYMIPMVVASGLIMAIAGLFAFQRDSMGHIIKWGFTDIGANHFAHLMYGVGTAGFTLMIPLFAGFIANSIADKPGIAPAMIGAYILNTPSLLHAKTGGGFIGAIIVAFIVGYMVVGLKMIPYPKVIRPLVPIFIIPLIATFSIAVIDFYILGYPISWLVNGLYSGLTSLNKVTWAPILLAFIMGGMIGFDLGGPINKIAWLFSSAVFIDTINRNGFYGANVIPLTATQAAISVPPMGAAISAWIFKKKYSKVERSSATSAFIMGLVGITEGSIPYAAADPWRMIVSNTIGSAVAAGLAVAVGCRCYGGIGSPLGTFVGFVEQPIPFITWILVIFAGVFVTAIIAGLLKKKIVETAEA